ncbi:MAG: hypothetical protein ABJ239_07340 [Erythrobacter sp.]
MAASGTVSRSWKNFFWIAAIFNFLIGLAGMLVPEATTDARIVGLLVFGMGIVYMQAARDPLRFAPTLWAGVIGKLGVVALLGPQAIGPQGEALIVSILACDALFAIGFLIFLLTKAEAAPVE